MDGSDKIYMLWFFFPVTELRFNGFDFRIKGKRKRSNMEYYLRRFSKLRGFPELGEAASQFLFSEFDLH